MSHRLRMALIAAGSVAVALGPLFVIDSVVRRVALEQGRANLENMADSMTSYADSVLDSASRALASLSRGGVDDCSPDSIANISEAVVSRAQLKEIGVYDADGRMVCSNFGPAALEIDRDGAIDAMGGTLGLSMVATRVPDHDALGLLRDGTAGSGGLAAIIEPSALVMALVHGAMAERFHARVELSDGTQIGRSGRTRAAVLGDDPEMIEVRRASARYPIVAAVAAPRAALLTPFMRLNTYARIGGGVIAMALLLLIGITMRTRPTLAADIDAGLAGDEFVPYYQPVVDAGSGRVAGCEVLVRWVRPNGEVVPPDQFVPFAEASGQIIELTRRLMRRVAGDLAEVCASDPGFRVGINLVAEHFANSDIVADVRRVFAGGGVAPGHLSFEVTERRPLGDVATARKVICELQGLGCEIALDDAGVGHGGLACIHELGLDAIKVDRLFVGAIGHDATKAPIVDALLDLGRELGMRVVAEGVETEQQFAYLRERGARYFQGYLFARPMPAASFIRFVNAFTPAPAAAPAMPVAAIGDTPGADRAAA